MLGRVWNVFRRPLWWIRLRKFRGSVALALIARPSGAFMTIVQENLTRFSAEYRCERRAYALACVKLVLVFAMSARSRFLVTYFLIRQHRSFCACTQSSDPDIHFAKRQGSWTPYSPERHTPMSRSATGLVGLERRWRMGMRRWHPLTWKTKTKLPPQPKLARRAKKQAEAAPPHAAE